jgi:plastocyanin
MDDMMNRDKNPRALAMRVVGGGLLFATAGIHLDLYLTGYHSIPTIGVLFLLQVISAFLLGLSVLARGGFLINASASAFFASTIGGYLLSRAVGLFGFHEVATTAGLVAGLVEVAGLVILGIAAVDELSSAEESADASPGIVQRIPARPAGIALGILGVAALVLVIVGGVGGTGSGSGSAAPASTATTQPSGSSTADSVKIVISNFAFSPADVTVKPGETIVVTNKDSVAHTFTAVPGSTPFGGFDSGDIGAGQTKSVTAPMKPGKYNYYCSIHNFMTGVLTVS